MGGISQPLSLVMGQSYTLSFYLSGNPAYGDIKIVEVSVGSFNNDFTYVTGSNSSFNMMYAHEVVTFVATGSDTLSFVSRDSYAYSACGPVIGGVSVTLNAPEPSTWAMMALGFAGLALAAYRKSLPATASA